MTTIEHQWRLQGQGLLLMKYQEGEKLVLHMDKMDGIQDQHWNITDATQFTL
jgi:hypothetical protein